MYVILLFSVFLNPQDIISSTDVFLNHSFYDIDYNKRLIDEFSDCDSIKKTTTTLDTLIFLKKRGYSRTEVNAFILCVCEKKLDFSYLIQFLGKGKRLKTFIDKHGCDYKKTLDKAYEIKKKIEDKKQDLNLLEKIFIKYFEK